MAFGLRVFDGLRHAVHNIENTLDKAAILKSAKSFADF